MSVQEQGMNIEVKKAELLLSYVHKGELLIVEALLKGGSDPNGVAADGKTALDVPRVSFRG